MSGEARADERRLRDVLEYGHAAVELAAERDGDLRWRLALERALFLVGEAGASLSPATRKRIAQPWPQIIGLRNLLAHRYEAVNVQRLVEVARQDLPALLLAVERDLAVGK